MSNERGFGASEASGAFRAAHDFAINNSTLNDVQGNYIHTQNYYEAPKKGKGSPSLRQALKPEDMDETNRTPCLKNTRRNVIDDILKWTADDSNKAKKVLWVYGLAGTGKSTLSTTIAQIMRSHHRLGAFFFFNRDIPQRNSGTLIRTLAYQLAIFDPRFNAAISQVVANNDNIAIMPLGIQFDNLLSANALKSVEWSRGPIVLIIDALDECGSAVDRKILMQVLSKGFSNLPSFIRIMVVSRPEPDIQRALRSHSRPYPLDIDSATNKDDVSAFIRHRLEEIRIEDGYLEDHWPGDDKIKSLADAADGLFIWASTACLYIDGFDPDERLSNLINKQTSSSPFAQLDILYKTGLSVGPWNDLSFSSGCRRILGVILCARVPLSHSVIDALLEFRLSRKIISYLRCVLDSAETGEIRILHASFYDYLVSERCRQEPWTVDLETHNKELALCCIKLLDKELRENICEMTLPFLSREKILPEVVSYASTFWIEHVCLISDIADDILNQIYIFLDKHLLHWMEVMALLKCHDRTIRSLDDLAKWLRKSSRCDTGLHQLLYDGHRFAQNSSNTITAHPLLLYTTALPFTPTNTSIFKKFYHSGLPKVVHGVDKTWSLELMRFHGHTDQVHCVAFSPDGSKIVSGSSDETIRVWDASTGIEMLPPLRGHSGRIASIAFSPDGSKFISGSDDKTIRVWDANSGIQILPHLRGHLDYIHSVALSPDGSRIISGSDDATIRVWDASTGIEMLPPFRGHYDSINSVAFSSDGSKIISGSRDKTIRVWDANSGVQILPPLRGHEDRILSVAFSPDGSKIFSESNDGTVCVWDASTGVKLFSPLRGHNMFVSVAFSHDGSKIISGCYDKTIQVWKVWTGVEMLPPLRGHDNSIRCVAFSPDGSKIISGSDDKTVRVWDASPGAEMLPPLRGHNQLIHSAAFSPDESKIISGSGDTTIRVWDANTGAEMLPPLRGHDALIQCVAFSPDGSKIISGSDDMTIRVWDTSTGAEILPPLQGHEDEITSVAFSPDGSKIISGSNDKTVRIWNASTGIKMFPPLRGHDKWVLSVSFSPDGSKIISGSVDATIRVWDAGTGTEILPPLRGHKDWITSVAFSPDGSKIISGSNDMTILVWDASTGVKMPLEIQVDEYSFDSSVNSVRFSPDGSKIISRSGDRIISRSGDAIIRVWDASTGILLPHPPIAADDTPRPEQMRAGWLTNIDTGRYMGALPVGFGFHSGQVRGYTYVGWTSGYKLVLVHFPEQ